MELKDLNKKNFRYKNTINYRGSDGIMQGKIYCINYTTLTVGDDSSRYTIKYNNIIPILLTEEWLVKLGFEYIKEASSYCLKDHLIYFIEDGNCIFNLFCSNDKDCRVKIQYVHQLQNLWHSLTNTELC